jgi:hypothetical protein
VRQEAEDEEEKKKEEPRAQSAKVEKWVHKDGYARRLHIGTHYSESTLWQQTEVEIKRV